LSFRLKYGEKKNSHYQYRLCNIRSVKDSFHKTLLNYFEFIDHAKMEGI